MASIVINSKKHGIFEVFVDEDDLERLTTVAWCISKGTSGKFYVSGYVKGSGRPGKHVTMHRFIMNLTDPDLEVDHGDGNSLNNRKNNLRICTHRQNQQNMRPNSEQPYKGVRQLKSGNWNSKIKPNKKPIHLGVYKTAEEAGIAYNKAAIQYYGEFAWLNPIDNWETTEIFPIKRKYSKFRGIYPNNAGNWRVSVNGIYFGTYQDETEAALVYNEKAKEILGDKAKLNVIC